MSLRKEVSGLSQSQGIENMNAVIGAKYFTDYSIYPSLSRIDSDLIDVKSIGGWKEENPDNLYQVNDLASTVNSLLSVIKSKGSLYEAQIRMIPPKEKLRELKFEDVDNLTLPLTMRVSNERHEGKDSYVFKVTNFGLDRDYYEANGLDFDKAIQQLNSWYKEVSDLLDEILPYKVSDAPIFED